MIAWLLSYWVHSTVLLALGWAVARFLGDRRLEAQEVILRVALVGGLVTATLQPVLGWGPALAWGGSAVERAAPPLDPRPEGPAARPSAGERPGEGREPVTSARPGDGGPGRVASPASAQQSDPWRATLGERLAALWGIGALLLGLRLAAGFAFARQRLRHRQAVRAGRLHALFRGVLRGEKRGAAFGLAQSERIAVPIALGILRPEVCVPVRLARQLPEEQQELVLAHESCHLLRRDPAWLALYRLIEATLFLQPLHRPVVRRLVEIAELRCDDWAARRTGRPLALARCLTEVASWGRGRGAVALAPTMAGCRGLRARVERLLRADELKAARPLSRAWYVAAISVLFVVALAAPRVVPAGPLGEGAPPAPETPASEPAAPEVPEAPASPPEAAAPAAPATRRAEPAGPAGWVRWTPPPATPAAPVLPGKPATPARPARPAEVYTFDRPLDGVEEIRDELAAAADRALDRREEALEGLEKSLTRADAELERQLEDLFGALEAIEDRIDRRGAEFGETSRRHALEERSREIRRALEGLEEALDGQAQRVEDHLEVAIEGHLQVAEAWVEREAQVREAALRERAVAELAAARQRQEAERLRSAVEERSRREAERLERSFEVELRRMERGLTPALEDELGAEIDALRRSFERRLEEQRRALERLRSQLPEH